MDTTRAVRPAPPQDGEDHWQWRPDWADRVCSFWYLTIPAGAVRLPELDAYTEALDRVPWLDTVPPRWWHLTLTDIGYDDERSPELLAEVGRAVASAVEGHGPVQLELGPVARFRTAVVLTAGPTEQLRALQQVVRERTQQVLGPDRPVVHPQRFRPHLSLAYLNRDVPAAQAAALLDDAPEVRATVPVDRVTLAAVTRRDRHYQWSVANEVRLTR